MEKKILSRDFALVIMGQIISLFGNAAIRFVLPLYLLNMTGSSALYGTVTACAILPAILMSPAGGIIADRINKRNIMITLDFLTAAVICLFAFWKGGGSLVVILTVTMMILYGIAGIYQPTVQASVPALVASEDFMAANAIINTVSSLSSLAGPVIGGILYSLYGIELMLVFCVGCFIASAIVEIFIHIPYVRQEKNGNIGKMVISDLKLSIRFIRKDKKIIGKALLIVCAINLFMSSMMNVGLPYLITEVLSFSSGDANRLYGYAEGVLAAGGLIGGICAGVFAKRLQIRRIGNVMILCVAAIFPMGFSLWFFSSAMINYLIIVISSFFVMMCASLYTVQIMSFVQMETPVQMIGKVIGVIYTVSMCAQPVGNAFYGILFEVCSGREFAVVLLAGGISMIIAVCTKNVFRNVA